MNQTVTASTHQTIVRMPSRRRRKAIQIPEPEMKFPPRGTTGPVHISELLNPLLEICSHPDRDRLLLEYFSR